MTHTVEIQRSKLLSHIKINCTDKHLLGLIDNYYYSLEELKVFVKLIDNVKATSIRNYKKFTELPCSH